MRILSSTYRATYTLLNARVHALLDLQVDALLLLVIVRGTFGCLSNQTLWNNYCKRALRGNVMRCNALLHTLRGGFSRRFSYYLSSPISIESLLLIETHPVDISILYKSTQTYCYKEIYLLSKPKNSLL